MSRFAGGFGLGYAVAMCFVKRLRLGVNADADTCLIFAISCGLAAWGLWP